MHLWCRQSDMLSLFLLINAWSDVRSPRSSVWEWYDTGCFNLSPEVGLNENSIALEFLADMISWWTEWWRTGSALPDELSSTASGFHVHWNQWETRHTGTWTAMATSLHYKRCSFGHVWVLYCWVHMWMRNANLAPALFVAESTAE